MSCKKDLSTLPILFGCPSNDELFLVNNAIGGYNNDGSGRGYAYRKWSDIKNCIIGTVVAPYIGVVDRGNPNDPVSGTPLFQNDLLIGLGANNNEEIQIVLAEILRSNFGDNKSFEFNSTTGEINLDYNSSGEQFTPGSSLYIDRNQ